MLDRAIERLRGRTDALARAVAEGDCVDSVRLDAHGPEALELAFDHARLEAARALDPDHPLAPVAHGLALRRLGLGTEALATRVLEPLGARILAEPELLGPMGLGDEHADLHDGVVRFAAERVAPEAERIHRTDALISNALLGEMGGLGLFGLSIPEEDGGCFVDHRAVVIATEALSRASLGAGGSVMTRPEICAKALLAGGTAEQRALWLPGIASGAHIVAVAATEPDAGSDVAALRVRARPTEDGYALSGTKTWCTFAGRADLLLVLARTGGPGHRGLSLFLVDKPVSRDRVFAATRGGGRMEGSAIATVGYRGMHSFEVTFEDWPVPASQRIGAEGDGFGLMMRGFEGGRIQTAARAVGVMHASVEAALDAVRARRVFGRTLGDLALTRVRIAEMAARLVSGRQLAYAVADRMDAGPAGVAPALVKLLCSRDAEWVTRHAMQLHGGLGYAEECAASRYWLDARVLSIFEGAEEVLALRVIARRLLRDALRSARV